MRGWSRPHGSLVSLLDFSPRWRRSSPLVKAEVLTTAWECFSALVFISAVVPAAFSSPWPAVIFVGGLALSSLAAARLGRRGQRGFLEAAAFRALSWLLAVTPLLDDDPVRLLVATCGFGLMAGGVRRAAYRRLLDPFPRNPTDARLIEDLNRQLSENATLAGIVGGHVMLLFSVAFLRTASQLVFRAWWEIIPALAILGTAGFNLAIRPTTGRIVAALAGGPGGDAQALAAALRGARHLPRRLMYTNFALWLSCTTIGVFYFRAGPENWAWADAAMQVLFGSLFAWGVSFYQRGWHQDALAPVVDRLERWTGQRAPRDEVGMHGRLLQEFGLPLLFAAILSLFASIGLYRTLAAGLSLREDFNAITALCASFLLLVMAVGGVFLRAARQLTDPLRTLAQAADRVASGRLEAAVPPVDAPIEVAGLGRSIEDMRQALARTIAELQEQRDKLEDNVTHRTAELSRALDELKRAQTALIHNERLASIGVLVAGVAHEIYNPLTAISGSISSLRRLKDELQQMLGAYEGAQAALPATERERLSALRAELDVDGALDDLAGVAKVAESATRRAVEIVSGLKSFAQAPAEPTPFDLAGGLRETLTLLRHQLRQASIGVVERYDDELTPVVCRAGEVNQVFMNLLTNAIHAVAEVADTGGARVIEVGLTREDRWAVVTVADSGPGVPDELRERIFDPFVSTKPRGVGTGLGLSISRDIVRRHGGTLELDPSPRSGERAGGAAFVCRLPLEPTDRRSS